MLLRDILFSFEGSLSYRWKRLNYDPDKSINFVFIHIDFAYKIIFKDVNE